MDIEIYDEGKSITFDDEFAINSFDISPETKTYTREFRIKDDYSRYTSKYEYKISPHPISGSIRLLESYSEPPFEYEVKDGVVLEADMKKDKVLGALREDHILKLKKDVKWHKFDDGPLLYYVLSLHPEIVGELEYKRFLRETEQRIKLGLEKVESLLKENDRTGLQIIEGKFGKQIWYQNTEEFSEKELGKKVEYVKKEFYSPLFDEKSKVYSGITDGEFSASAGILKDINLFLERKTKSKTSTISKTSNTKPTSNSLKMVLAASLILIALYWGVWTALGIGLFCSFIYFLLKEK